MPADHFLFLLTNFILTSCVHHLLPRQALGSYVGHHAEHFHAREAVEIRHRRRPGTAALEQPQTRATLERSTSQRQRSQARLD